MDLISIHSRVVWGYVGNAAAVPVLQAFGVNVWPLDTVTLAHHPGHGLVDKHITPPSVLSKTLRGVIERSPDAAVLIGYLGTGEQGEAILDTLHNVDHRGPLFVDPVIGDDPDGVYVPDDVVSFFRKRALPAANILLPNRFELSEMAQTDVSSVADAIAVARQLISDHAGLETVVASSIPDTSGNLHTLAITAQNTWRAQSPQQPLKAKGTGDVMAAAFVSAYLSSQDTPTALASAVGTTDLAIGQAVRHNAVELDIVRLVQAVNADSVSRCAVTEV